MSAIKYTSITRVLCSDNIIYKYSSDEKRYSVHIIVYIIVIIIIIIIVVVVVLSTWAPGTVYHNIYCNIMWCTIVRFVFKINYDFPTDGRERAPCTHGCKCATEVLEFFFILTRVFRVRVYLFCTSFCMDWLRFRSYRNLISFLLKQYRPRLIVPLLSSAGSYNLSVLARPSGPFKTSRDYIVLHCIWKLVKTFSLNHCYSFFDYILRVHTWRDRCPDCNFWFHVTITIYCNILQYTP
jgi:hypothetical protein